jgi:wyosine [tRNA(Phe)-imidazoG37] synthetase (radical SAM superfamily)
MKYVFGPVPSRRLGQSLGIDPIPLKTCNWNCVYCQLGRTVPLTNERREYVLDENILFEAQQVLSSRAKSGIDWVTFVGSGEPTLHIDLGEMILRVKKLTTLPVAVITNGSLLYLPEVRHDLSAADAVLPTLDAGTPELYRKINRPHPDIAFERLVDGLLAFRAQYAGKLWIEVMLVRGLNDTRLAIEDTARVLRKVGPDAIHINLPTRPPAEAWVQPPDHEGLMRAMSILGNIAEVVHPAEGDFDLGGCTNVVDAIISIITRHPMREDELERTLERWPSGQVASVLADLQASGRAQLVERSGMRFWSTRPSFYASEAQSWLTDPRRRQGSKRRQHT